MGNLRLLTKSQVKSKKDDLHLFLLEISSEGIAMLLSCKLGADHKCLWVVSVHKKIYSTKILTK